jgi:TM2 domain-containing membrane protein YozV
MSICLNCGLNIPANEIDCPHCQQNLDKTFSPSPQPLAPNPGDPGPGNQPQTIQPYILAWPGLQPQALTPYLYAWPGTQPQAPTTKTNDPEPGAQPQAPTPYILAWPGTQPQSLTPYLCAWPVLQPQALLNAQTPGQLSPKSKTMAMALCLFLGWLGIHRLYLGKTLSGIAMLLTLGGLGIWTFIDFILLFTDKLKDGQKRPINTNYNKKILICLIIIALIIYSPIILLIIKFLMTSFGVLSFFYSILSFLL